MDVTSSAAIPGAPVEVVEPLSLARLQRDTFAVMRRAPAVFLGLPVLLSLPVDIVGQLPVPSFTHTFLNVFASAAIAAFMMEAIAQLGRGEQPTWSTVRPASKHLDIYLTLLVANLIAGFAFVLLLIPGLWMTAKFALVAPAAIHEGLRGGAARKRSAELIAGFGVGRMIGWLLFAACWLGLGLLPAVVIPMFANGHGVVVDGVINVLVGVPLSLVNGGMAVAAALLYRDLAGVPGIWPAGNQLREADGRLQEVPRAAGIGLVAVIVAGAVALLTALPLLAFFAYASVDPKAAHDMAEESPLLMNVLYGPMIDLPADAPVDVVGDSVAPAPTADPR